MDSTVTPAQARSIVLSSAAIIALSSILRQIKAGEVPSVSVPIGAAMMALILGSFANRGPLLSASFAALGATSAILRDPNELSALLAGALTRKVM